MLYLPELQLRIRQLLPLQSQNLQKPNHRKIKKSNSLYITQKPANVIIMKIHAAGERIIQLV